MKDIFAKLEVRNFAICFLKSFTMYNLVVFSQSSAFECSVIWRRERKSSKSAGWRIWTDIQFLRWIELRSIFHFLFVKIDQRSKYSCLSSGYWESCTTIITNKKNLPEGWSSSRLCRWYNYQLAIRSSKYRTNSTFNQYQRKSKVSTKQFIWIRFTYTSNTTVCDWILNKNSLFIR